MESIFDEIDKKRIAPQRFEWAVVACVSYIVLTYVYVFCSEENKQAFYLLNQLVGIIVLFFFIKYLQNFKSDTAVFWTRFNIVFSIVALIVSLLLTVSRAMLLHTYVYHLFSSLASIIILLLFVLGFIILIAGGIAYMKIGNEPTGLIKKIGIVNAFILPLPYLCMFVFFLANARHKFPHDQYTLIMLVFGTLFLIPTFIMGIVFYRVNKIQAQNDISTDS